MNSETAFAGIFSLLSPLSATFITISRRLQLVDTMAAGALPAVFQNQASVSTLEYQTADTVAAAVLKLDWYVYAFTPSATLPTTPILNPLVDAVLGVLPPVGNALFVTDGSGKSIRIGLQVDGPIQYTEGLLGNYAVARVPLKAIVAEGIP